MRHLWIIGASPAERRASAEVDFSVSCHRRLRGPFTGAGSLLSELVPRIHSRWPELVHEHRFAILIVAPELVEFTGEVPKTLHMAASIEERTRYQTGLARRAAHSVVELLVAYARQRGEGALRLAFDAAHAADATDQEFLAILLRRADPALLQVHVGTKEQPLPEALAEALAKYSTSVTVQPSAATPAESSPRSHDALLRAYIEGHGTSDDPEELAAWSRAAPRHRAELHDAAADALSRRGDLGDRLGAIPFHREHGSDPAGAGVRALEFAAQYCAGQGFTVAAVDLARRGLARLTPDRPREYCLFNAILSLSLRGTDPKEAERILNELRGAYAQPEVHRSTSYSIAMLHAVFHAEKNLPLAKAYTQNALAFAGLVEDARERSFRTSFLRNALALIEMRLGNPAEALRLVTSAIELLVEELPEDAYRQHHSVLHHNRAKVYQLLGMFDAAARDFDDAIALDPYFPEFRYDRGNLARLRGDDAAAVGDYEAAMALSAPILEAYYSRGDVRAATGDVDGAIADFGYVLDLEPDHRDARINRAALLFEAGDLDRAAEDVGHGLAADPRNAHLLCTRGQIAMEREEHDLARTSFAEALTMAPELSAALVNSAVLDYTENDFDAAVAKLTKALDLTGDDPDLRYNRGVANQAAGRFDAAIEDFEAALKLPEADEAQLRTQIDLCRIGSKRAPAATAR
ncbi:tetratricopeptide repeat protein [Pendulispora rubella]|uniref:Tetratricopeptide repeat protein n=1 Tax=Pendulispora rubella TaxID=2741070 RepID=A0ABZ2L1G4_9BACT